MTAVFDETQRLELQRLLDSAKTQSERNKLGQFATPSALADEMLEYAHRALPENIEVRFADPAFGTGSFYSSLLRSFPHTRIARSMGWEIDPDIGREAQKLWAHTPLELTIGDFTQSAAPRSDAAKATLIVCNPPYVRHHHLASSDKVRLQWAAKKMTGVSVSGLAGLYCYFLLLSHAWMAEGAVAVWLIPSEFMDVNYGRQVKRYLLDLVTLVRIHRFEPSDVQFSDALVSSSVVVFEKTPPPQHHSVEFTYGGSLAEPSLRRRVSANALKRTAKWTGIPTGGGRDESPERPRLGHFFDIKRGIATGANGFFIVTADQVTEHGLPAEFLRPILPSPRHLSLDEIEEDSCGNPKLPQPLFLLTCDLPEDVVKDRHPRLWEYLQDGVGKGIRERYLCRHRTPWYAQESRLPPPLLCTYMGRVGSTGSSPFRFIINHSRAIAANVYLMLYPNGALREAISTQPELLREVWEALRAIPVATLVGSGRVYGGGLHKLEPKELADAPADAITELAPMLARVQPYQPALWG